MPVPKRKRSRARRDSRFANKGMVMHTITACKNCDSPLLPHAACHTCGFYKGAKVMSTKVDRKLSRLQARQIQSESKKSRKQAAASSADSVQ